MSRRPCIEVDRIPDPNPSLLGKLIYESSQSHPDPTVFNVTILTSDGKSVYSIREVLALGNSIFKDLCMAEATERTDGDVVVNIPHKELLQILQFIYVDDCPLLRSAKDFMNGSNSFPCERVKDIITLARAADTMEVERLVARCSVFLQNMMMRFKGVICVIYQELREEHVQADWIEELSHATQCLAALFPMSTLSKKCECGLSCGIMHISDEDAVAFFRGILRQILDDKSMLPYVFQAVLVWASDGTALVSSMQSSVGGERVKFVDMDKMQMSSRRVGKAKQICNLFDLTLFKPRFLFEIVERCGLAEPGELIKAYRTLLFHELNESEECDGPSRMPVPCQLQVRESND